MLACGEDTQQFFPETRGVASVSWRTKRRVRHKGSTRWRTHQARRLFVPGLRLDDGLQHLPLLLMRGCTIPRRLCPPQHSMNAYQSRPPKAKMDHAGTEYAGGS